MYYKLLLYYTNCYKHNMQLQIFSGFCLESGVCLCPNTIVDLTVHKQWRPAGEFTICHEKSEFSVEKVKSFQKWWKSSSDMSRHQTWGMRHESILTSLVFCANGKCSSFLEPSSRSVGRVLHVGCECQSHEHVGGLGGIFP